MTQSHCHAKRRCQNPNYCKDQSFAGACQQPAKERKQKARCPWLWIKGDGYRNHTGVTIPAPYTQRGREVNAQRGMKA